MDRHKKLEEIDSNIPESKKKVTLSSKMLKMLYQDVIISNDLNDGAEVREDIKLIPTVTTLLTGAPFALMTT